MTRYTYRPLDERLEARRRAAMDFLGAVALAIGVVLPVALHWMGVL